MKTKLLFFFLTFSSLLQAQYTFITDRRFFEPNDLIGYDFKPGSIEIPNEIKEDLNPGQFSFGITLNHLYVKGEDIAGVYNINNIQPADYGYKLLLMNARDARLQGHLKVILNKYSMVEALIFKRSPDDKEIIFYQLPIAKKQQDQERSYFTDRGELILENTDSIWGKTIHPFLIIHEDEKVTQRLYMKDSTSISFTEEITIEEKEIKKKRSKKSKEEEMVIDSTIADTPKLISGDTAQLDDPEKKIKIIKEYFVIVRSIVEYADGTKEDKSWKYPVKKINVREDESAGIQEERFQWEFVNDDKENIFLYSNGDYTVSTMIVGTKKYLMRGF